MDLDINRMWSSVGVVLAGAAIITAVGIGIRLILTGDKGIFERLGKWVGEAFTNVDFPSGGVG